tara:strand:+ start:191 stop:685 length:495 start_codon:yes stop_codon:yes gene_type:complete
MADLTRSFQTVSNYNSKDTSVIQELNFDIFEISVLQIMRYFCEAFEQPVNQAWKLAFLEAERIFPPPFGATIAHAISITIDMVCLGRKRKFSYFRRTSTQTNNLITDEERYFLMTLHYVRRGKRSSARTYAMMVNEGSKIEAFLSAIERLAIITGDLESPVFKQ